MIANEIVIHQVTQGVHVDLVRNRNYGIPDKISIGCIVVAVTNCNRKSWTDTMTIVHTPKSGV